MTSYEPGQIYRHNRFYRDPDAQTWQSKYLLLLSDTAGGDIIFRLLTSRAHGRPESPRCYHGDPYPSFYLGHLGGELGAKSWLDLRKQDDYDGQMFAKAIAGSMLVYIMTLSKADLCLALDCAARADDTTRQQEQQMLNQRVALNCP